MPPSGVPDAFLEPVPDALRSLVARYARGHGPFHSADLAGRYALDSDGSPIPGTYEEVESTPSRIVVDSLEAPINGLYGIEDPGTGNVDVFNSGELFGAIDVALFILVIGGFLGVTMRTR